MRKISKTILGKIKIVEIPTPEIDQFRIYAFCSDTSVSNGRAIYFLKRDSTPGNSYHINPKPYSFKSLDNTLTYFLERFETIEMALKYAVKKQEVFEFESQKEFLKWALKSIEI